MALSENCNYYLRFNCYDYSVSGCYKFQSSFIIYDIFDLNDCNQV